MPFNRICPESMVQTLSSFTTTVRRLPAKRLCVPGADMCCWQLPACGRRSYDRSGLQFIMPALTLSAPAPFSSFLRPDVSHSGRAAFTSAMAFWSGLAARSAFLPQDHHRWVPERAAAGSGRGSGSLAHRTERAASAHPSWTLSAIVLRSLCGILMKKLGRDLQNRQPSASRAYVSGRAGPAPRHLLRRRSAAAESG